ncbi:peptidoglycan-binding domain-containing protein [Streptomyces albicerus]|uniref:peptidoglycan-binding domain-containing protein n=1 Tax=Streptomyces albicerus TaxID=2569859 RepID=UPI001788A278|nr:peptidoglycan-binding domain-containing protein [Streptomyces albicerus]
MRKTGKSKALLATGTMMAALLGGVITAAPANAADGVCTGSTTQAYGSDLYFVLPINVANNTIFCYLQYGNTGAGVRALQKNLNSCYGKRLELDGSFGLATEDALRDVQGRIGAVVDGEYGRETMLKMKWARYNNETGARYDCNYLP